jgi:hypothetical protein
MLHEKKEMLIESEALGKLSGRKKWRDPETSSG